MKVVKPLIFVVALSLLLLTGCHDSSDDSNNYTEKASDINMKMVYMPAGTFQMGSTDTDTDAFDDERPRHQVQLDAFYIGATEVTQAQWKAIMGDNPSVSDCDDCPVDQVSFEDIQAFITALNNQTGVTYRLPTEAEWEYACRAGTETAYFFGDTEDNMDLYAWTAENAGGKTHPVGQKIANSWGLYDMYGNVEEFCLDWYGEDYYATSPSANPLNTDNSSGLKATRGGSFEDAAWQCRSAYRMWEVTDYRFDALGFRLARDAD